MGVLTTFDSEQILSAIQVAKMTVTNKDLTVILSTTVIWIITVLQSMQWNDIPHYSAF